MAKQIFIPSTWGFAISSTAKQVGVSLHLLCDLRSEKFLSTSPSPVAFSYTRVIHLAVVAEPQDIL